MPIPPHWAQRLRLPLIAAPLFLSSGPDLVVAVSGAGGVGALPALNARTTELLDEWLTDISTRLDAVPAAAPFATNLVVHRTNSRLDADLALLVRHQVPLVITSLGAVREVVDAVHSYGGSVFHDVTTVRHARKAAEAGVDGLILVSAGAGGHGGLLNPFAFLHEVRVFFDGTLVLAGALSTGQDIAAARMLGADLAYMGTRFNAAAESMAVDAYKQMLVDADIADIRYRYDICSAPANFLRQSLAATGHDPDVEGSASTADITELTRPHGPSNGQGPRPWRDIWSAGHGVGSIREVLPAGELVERLRTEYDDAVARFAASSGALR
jgi:nitronate monooxygenase